MVIEKNIKNNQLIRIAPLLLLVILGGCKARQLTRPTPQMDIEPQFWVRVLLLDDVTDCQLKTRSPFSVGTRDNLIATRQHFGQVNVPINVSGSGGRMGPAALKVSSLPITAQSVAATPKTASTYSAIPSKHWLGSPARIVRMWPNPTFFSGLWFNSIRPMSQTGYYGGTQS